MSSEPAPLTDEEIQQFMREYDEGKHPLSAEDEAALERTKPELFRRLRAQRTPCCEGLREALKEQKRIWELAAPMLDQRDDRLGRVRFTELHKPITAIDEAIAHPCSCQRTEEEIRREHKRIAEGNEGRLGMPQGPCQCEVCQRPEGKET